jgi:8-oxo-dGTP diphosphatase
VVRVVAAVVRREGRYLLGLRSERKRHGGMWEFPGGKVDPGESTLEAARRELAEELEMEVTSVGELVLSVVDGHSPFVIDFVDAVAVGSPSALEHDALGWFTVDEMLEMRLAPADARFVAHLAGVLDHGSGDALTSIEHA